MRNGASYIPGSLLVYGSEYRVQLNSATVQVAIDVQLHAHIIKKVPGIHLVY